MIAQQKEQKRIEIEKKNRNRSLGDGGPVGTATPSPAKSRPKTIREAVLQAEEQFMQNEAWRPDTYGLHAGHPQG